MNPLKNSQPGIWDYLFELRQKGIYKPKQRRVLTQIVIYTNELKVYKVAVFADERKKNKWNKYKVKELYKTYTPAENDKNISFPLLKHELIGSETGTVTASSTLSALTRAEMPLPGRNTFTTDLI